MKDDSEYIGKRILVGLTFLDSKGQLARQLQYQGVISRITAKGIFVRLPNGEDHCSLPPDTACLKKATPGEYRLRSTGEIITNPDYLAQWTITKKDDAAAEVATTLKKNTRDNMHEASPNHRARFQARLFGLWCSRDGRPASLPGIPMRGLAHWNSQDSGAAQVLGKTN